MHTNHTHTTHHAQTHTRKILSLQYATKKGRAIVRGEEGESTDSAAEAGFVCGAPDHGGPLY